MYQTRRESAHEATPAGVVLMRDPAIESLGVGEILPDHRVEQAFVEIGGGALDLVLQHPARQDVRRGHAIDAVLYERVVGIGDPLAGLHQEVDDFRQRHVQQGWHLGTRVDEPVEVDPRRGEVDAEIAGPMYGVVALEQLATREKRGGDNGWLTINYGAHATPLTY